MKQITVLLFLMVAMMTHKSEAQISISSVATTSWYDTARITAYITSAAPADVQFVVNTPAFQLDTTLHNVTNQADLVLRNLPLGLNEQVDILASSQYGTANSGTILHTKNAETLLPEVNAPQGDAAGKWFALTGNYRSKELASICWFEITALSGVVATFHWKGDTIWNTPAEEIYPNAGYDWSSFPEGWYEIRLIAADKFYGNDTSTPVQFFLHHNGVGTEVVDIHQGKSFITVMGSSGLYVNTPEPVQLEVYDLQGRRIFNQKVGTGAITISSPPGIYLARLNGRAQKFMLL